MLGQLSACSSPHPAVSDLIRAEADANPQFRNSAEYLIWSHRAGRRDVDLFRACLAHAGSFTFRRTEPDEVYDLLVDPDLWQIPAETLCVALTQPPDFDTDPQLRAVFCELFPNNERSRTMLADLEAWFRSDEPRDRREWIDSLTIAVRCSPASVLPVIVERAHHQIMLRDAAALFPLLTGPLLRRLRHDPDAVTALRSAIQDAASADTSTPIWAQVPQARPALDSAMNTQRSYLLATALDHAGLLDEGTATLARTMLTAINPDVVVHNPFTGAERRAHVAAASLDHTPFGS